VAADGEVGDGVEIVERRDMGVFKGSRIVLAVVCGGLVASVPAPAVAQSAANAAGSLGQANFEAGGQPAQGGPFALCQVDGVAQNVTNGASVGTTVRYGPGHTTCSRDQNGAATATAAGERFETTVLRRLGGPTIRVRSFSATCSTTGNGSKASVSLDSVSGVPVPSDIPAGYTMVIPGRTPADPPMAEVVLNELVVPSPPDGSLTANAMHIKLFPKGGPASGDITVGSVSCAPFGS
jgi:hypothetical protein